MWEFLERTVEIQISNMTQNVTLENPRTYFYSGHSSFLPRPCVPPSSSDTCRFSSPPFRGCVGVLVYEATTFTMAIFFSNPLDYNLFPMELGLELSLLRAHLGRLEDTYTRMSQMGTLPTSNETTVGCHVTLDTCQEPVQVSVGRVKVAATMSNTRRSIIRVVLEDQECSGREVGERLPFYVASRELV
ncbi:hypothetical protein HGM15179_020118 [Zosterops borbonicus]|uniref:Uncharacterized protein n=1 Tax=Zosterops borbonicus TaxID=364589 RepID=A0A8K1D6W3_9PASS|nr:hypothetical protein HGM15179_022525 [Zosterops borbonicus]TRZ06989.1 hypothetical protein HGM15179_020118 [Zosterops borbonicus]